MKCNYSVRRSTWSTCQSPGSCRSSIFELWLCEFLSGKIDAVPRVVCFCVCVQWNLMVLTITLVVVVIILFGSNCKCPHDGCSSETIGIINVLGDLIFCADSLHLYEEAGWRGGGGAAHTECDISRLLDFISTSQAKGSLCVDRGLVGTCCCVSVPIRWPSQKHAT